MIKYRLISYVAVDTEKVTVYLLYVRRYLLGFVPFGRTVRWYKSNNIQLKDAPYTFRVRFNEYFDNLVTTKRKFYEFWGRY